MATSSSKIENEKNERDELSLSAAAEDSTLLKLLQEANGCSEYSRKANLLASGASQIASNQPATIVDLMLDEHFQSVLTSILESVIIPAFDNKEYFSYKKEDFHNYPELTYNVLSIINNILERLEHIDKEKHTDKGMGVERPLDIHNLNFYLPKLLIVIGAHTSKPLWSSSKVEDLNMQVLDRLLMYFSCESSNELLCIHKLNDSQIRTTADHKLTIFNAILLYCMKPLSKNTWHQNPFLCQTFHWLILQMKIPNLSDLIEQIMSVSLNFLEDYQPVTKIRGISCLHHLIENTSAEEMRWLNRADVICEKLKSQMYSKEAAVVECLLPCLFDVLKILESPPNLDHHFYVLDTLLRDTEGENLLVLRKIYVRNLKILLEQMSINCVRHLHHFIKIVGNYLEIDDGLVEMSARPDALKLLESVIKCAWPRIQPYADDIFKMCLNFIADINCTVLNDSKTLDTQAVLTEETIRCLVLLSEICPDVLLCLKAALTAGMDTVAEDSQFYTILQKQLANIDRIAKINSAA